MKDIDETILRGKMPEAPASDAEPAEPGCSYYWDARAEGLDHEQAVRRAARYMGVTIASVKAVERYR